MKTEYDFFDKIDAQECILKTQKYCKDNGVEGIVLGISGGKDSTVVAKLFAEAIGPENVVGVLMPNGKQLDIEDSRKIVDMLGIRSMEINIEKAFNGTVFPIDSEFMNKRILDKNMVSEQALVNIAPRLRMTVLYAICQTLGSGYRVCGTTNYSEYYIGWYTKWGDGAADIEPIINLTCSQVIELGFALGLPKEFLLKAPSDGLSEGTDEMKLGFTYKQLDRYIKTGTCVDTDIDAKIKAMHETSSHKRKPINIVL